VSRSLRDWVQQVLCEPRSVLCRLRPALNSADAGCSCQQNKKDARFCNNSGHY
jgi:hypothetical protein